MFVRALCDCDVRAIQLRTTDLWAPATMKNAAKCDTRCDAHEPVSHRIFERNLRLRACLLEPAQHWCSALGACPRNVCLPPLICVCAASCTPPPLSPRTHCRSARQDHPLDLSISVSGGEETNRDSRSSGERSGNSSVLESRKRIVDRRAAARSTPGALERAAAEGDSPVGVCARSMRLERVGLLGNAAQRGWYVPPKAKYGQETDSEQVP